MDIEQKADKLNKEILSKFGNILKIKKVKTSSHLVLFHLILDKIRDKKYIINTGHKFNLDDEENQLFYRLMECRNLEQVFIAMGGYTQENLKLINTL